MAYAPQRRLEEQLWNVSLLPIVQGPYAAPQPVGPAPAGGNDAEDAAVLSVFEDAPRTPLAEAPDGMKPAALPKRALQARRARQPRLGRSETVRAAEKDEHGASDLDRNGRLRLVQIPVGLHPAKDRASWR